MALCRAAVELYWVKSIVKAGGAPTAVTAMAPAAVRPSQLAVIVADPSATAVTTPPVLTKATGALSVDHAIVRPVKGLPLASRGVAVSCTVCPTVTLAVAGLTVTDATGTLVTVMAAVLVALSHAAVMMAVPAASAVTSPVPFTVATPGLPLVHVTARPVKTFPFASFGVAASCTVCPTMILAVAGLTVTEATGTPFTVTVAVPLLPSLVAVIDAEPGATPDTSPLPFTVATAALLLDHVTTRPDSGTPLASRGVAVSCTVCPADTLADAGLTATDATGTTVMVIAEVPLFVSLVAVIVADPAAVPVTNPLAFTVATPGVLLDHITVRPESGAPVESFGVAVSCTACPTVALAAAGVTATAATGTWVTVMAAVSEMPLLVAATLYLPSCVPELYRP